MLLLLVACGMDPLGGVPDNAVRGRVCDPANSLGVVGAEVSSGDAGTVTEPGGVFLLEGLADGEHTLMVEKGRFSTMIDVELDGVGVDLDEACLDAGSVAVALIRGGADDVGVVLDELGITYDSYEDAQLLRDRDSLLQYDVLLLPSGIEDTWTEQEQATGKVLEDFLVEGGSVYASGASSDLVDAAISEDVEFIALDRGSMLRTKVLDDNMRKHLGSSDATVEATSWTAMATTDGRVLLQADAPIAATLDVGEGRLTYTSFHYGPDVNEDTWMLLEEMLLSL
ncbi:MAG TPA: hypothetical protein QGF58_19725 [Myxococcota bacterium]|nr:hypothetical protein [Myxococcota bacterium]